MKGKWRKGWARLKRAKKERATEALLAEGRVDLRAMVEAMGDSSHAPTVQSERVEFEKCADCEGSSVALLGDNGMLYCYECADEYLNCQLCNQLAIGGRASINGVELCDECFGRND